MDDWHRRLADQLGLGFVRNGDASSGSDAIQSSLLKKPGLNLLSGQPESGGIISAQGIRILLC